MMSALSNENFDIYVYIPLLFEVNLFIMLERSQALKTIQKQQLITIQKIGSLFVDYDEFLFNI